MSGPPAYDIVAASRVRSLLATMRISRADAAALLRAIADELVPVPGAVDEHVRAAAQIEADALRAQGFTVVGARLEVRTIAAAAVLGRSEGTLRNWRCYGDGPEWRSEGGVIWYSLVDLMAWRQGASRTVTVTEHADVL